MAGTNKRSLCVGLFAGIGGIECGLARAGFESTLLCEIEPHAQAVLRARFPGADLVADIRGLEALPAAEVVAGGFPCQDLSQAGRTAGIDGRNSGLVSHVFELLSRSSSLPRWLVLENVSFMLRLDRGEAMRYLIGEIEALGMSWAYRVVDTRSFGLPQRRQRVILVASAVDDPRGVLLYDEASEPEWPDQDAVACGFYWTEGVRGLGWAVDAVPTLKGGSTIGIPSPPAVRLTDRSIVTPHVRDAERLQGFEADWTSPTLDLGSRRASGARWKLIGNAVSVPVAEWLGRRLRKPGRYDGSGDAELGNGALPNAAWGREGRAFAATRSMFPVEASYTHLEELLVNPMSLLSTRAARGFHRRTQSSSLRFPPGLIDDVVAHIDRTLARAPLLA